MIYFIRQRTLFKTLVKIGFTDQKISKRLSVTKTYNPNKLDVLLVLPGDRGLEDAYHNMFERYRIDPKREWFRYGISLRLFVLFNKNKVFDFNNVSDLKYEDCEAADENLKGLDQRYNDGVAISYPDSLVSPDDVKIVSDYMIPLIEDEEYHATQGNLFAKFSNDHGSLGITRECFNVIYKEVMERRKDEILVNITQLDYPTVLARRVYGVRTPGTKRVDSIKKFIVDNNRFGRDDQEVIK